MQMILELADAVEMLKKDSEVRVVVLTGIGKAFVGRRPSFSARKL